MAKGPTDGTLSSIGVPSCVETKRAGFYDNPSIYDVLHARGTAAEVDGLERIASRFVRTGTRRMTWLEPACGTGRYLRVAAGRGTRVVGFDRSEAMVRYAAGRMPPGSDARVLVAEMTRFADEVGSVDFAFNLINTIRHLESDGAMLEHFGEMARVLRPGGVYAVGLSTTIRGLEAPTEDVWHGKRGRCEVRQVVQYLPPTEPGDRVEQVISHIEVTRPSGVERIDSTYGLRTYERGEWLGLLERSALQEIATTDERGERVEPPTIGYALHLLTHRGS